eukprot:SAG22_NODE_6624_length_830_cov_1.250342_1_plen_52_part_10
MAEDPERGEPAVLLRLEAPRLEALLRRHVPPAARVASVRVGVVPGQRCGTSA